VSVAFEATAPCRVDLAHGEVAVNVAIDRRAWCRVETGFAGVAVESKDTLQRLRADRVAELEAIDWGLVPASHLRFSQLLEIGRLIEDAAARDDVDGVVVGSALVEVLERGEDPAAFIDGLRP